MARKERKKKDNMVSPEGNLRHTFNAIQRDISRYAEAVNRKNIAAVVIESMYAHPSFVGVIYYRIGRWFWLSRQNPLMVVLLVFHRILYPFVRIYSGLELSPRAQIGPGLRILHFGPTVIHPAVIAGENLTVLRGVTIGLAKGRVPRIGNDVYIGTGASVLGGIVVGSNVKIGAGAVVVTDLPDGCTAVGIPARPTKDDFPMS